MTCPNCQNLKTEFFFEAKNTHGSLKISEEKFVILKCQDCGLIFPRLTPGKDFYKQYYPQDYYQRTRFPIKAIEKTYQTICLRWLEFLIARYIKKGKVLDYGCGRGEFLASLPEAFEKYGIEINPQAAKSVKKNYPQIKVFQDLSFLRPKALKFDLITLWHVLEHLEEPKKVLSRLVSLLEKDGFLILSTPNSQSLGLKIGRAHWFHLDAPRHLRIFSLNNLSDLAKETGLKIIAVKGNWLEYPLDLFWSVYNHLKTKIFFLNFLLGLFILPVSLVIKTVFLFLPQKSEVITLVCQKR